jgi:carbon-monoxide dehydrogenase large subunit
VRQLIGQSLPRVEDKALLRGQGRFVDDIAVPNVLHAAFVRSPHPHAHIRGIDTAEAARLAGVVRVLTLNDLSTVLLHERMLRRSNSGTALEKVWPYALCPREVSFVGEAVAMVVAESRYIAEDAANMVTVDYDVLDSIADCTQAVRPDALCVREELKSNTIATFKVGYGDVEEAFRRAPHVFSQTLSQHRGCAHPLEGRGLLAEVMPSDDSLIVWASTQKAHDLASTILSLVDIDERKLRVATPDVGGGFGPKLCVYPEDIAVVAAARLLRRSVKWIEDRREHFTNAAQERDQQWSMHIAVDGEGKILGVRGDLLHDQGAYALQDVNLPYNSASATTGPYIVPAFAMNVAVVMTNKGPVSSVRGAGYPQATFAIERLMDLVAGELGLDRALVRRRNLIPPDKMPYELPIKARSGSGIKYDSGDYHAALATVLEKSGWNDFPARQAKALAEGRYIGIGLANAVKGTGRGPFESGTVKVSPSGKVSIFTGAAPMGQGLASALTQICAEQLGVDADDVRVVAGDTATVSLGMGGFASRQLVTAGSSVLLASRAVAAKVKTLASHMLEVAEQDLEFADGAVRVVGAPQLNVRLAEAARILQGAPGYGFPPGVEPGLESNIQWRTDALAYANACHAVEVEVDVETGNVHILRYIALQDSGRLVNPMIVDGQVRGGVVHGIGNALFEWMGYDDKGQPVTMTFADYLLPSATEVPMFETLYMESPSPLNPLGAKGVGEVGTVPAAPAIVSAIENALKPFGVRISQVPIFPVRLIELIEAGRGASTGFAH